MLALAKATCAKLQPHTKDFWNLSNPKAMLVNNPFGIFVLHEIAVELDVTDVYVFLSSLCSLETTLRSYTCLTTGDTIMICYNQKNYYINVIETKPSPAVSIVETDCEVDFALL